MADNKKHHYVPKAYLRNFATDIEKPAKMRRLINQLDVVNQSWRFNIGLNDQCQSPYLYGKTPELEKVLNDFEGEFATVFREIINDKHNKINDPHTELYLRYFALLSILRTPRQKSYAEDFLNDVVNKITEKNFPDYEGGLEVSYHGFYHLVVGNLTHFTVSLDGMKSLVVNSDEGLFVTSDNPVIRHNQAFQHISKTHANLGFLSKGLQIIFPISSEKLIMFYDEDSYKISNSSPIATVEDVKMLNDLQVLNCDNSVYFSRREATKFIPQRRVGKENRNTGKSKITTLQHTHDPLRELVIQKEIRTVPNLPLSFIRPRKNLKYEKNKLTVPLRRDPDYVKALSEYIEEENERRFRHL